MQRAPSASWADECRQAARMLWEANSAIAFTGAGVSTESGIPDFRSPTGIWARSRPVYFQEFVASEAARLEYWRQKCEAHLAFRDAQPNTGHFTLAQWQSAGRLRGIITQNIDGLHQAAGSSDVLELHGTVREIECIDCQGRFAPLPLLDEFGRSGRVPPCPGCGGRLKSATVLFGQELPQEIWRHSVELCEQADLLLAIGSSLVVEPAASLPRLVARNQAQLIIINREATPLDGQARLAIRASIGDTLGEIDRCLRNTYAMRDAP